MLRVRPWRSVVVKTGGNAAFWRGGDGRNISLNDEKNTWFDFASGEGGGMLDLVVRVQGGSRAEALRWVAELVGNPLSDRPFFPAERRESAVELRKFARDVERARYWKRAAVVLAEEQLVVLKRDRDQLWAEAVASYCAGEKWWIDCPELTQQARDAQAERYDEDAWQSIIEAWLEGRNDVSVEELLTQCLDKPRGSLNQLDKNRVARCLKAMRWDRRREPSLPGLTGTRTWRYYRPQA